MDILAVETLVVDISSSLAVGIPFVVDIPFVPVVVDILVVEDKRNCMKGALNDKRKGYN